MKDPVSPIFPLVIGDEQQALRLAEILYAQRLFGAGHSLPDGSPRIGSSSDRALLFTQSGADTIALKNHNCVAMMQTRALQADHLQMAVWKGNSGKGVKLSSLST